MIVVIILVIVFIIVIAYSFDECSYNNKYLDEKIKHETNKKNETR